MLTSLAYMTGTERIGGKIKTTPEDFIVEEILDDGTVLEIDKAIQRNGSSGKFVKFVLQKRDWTTEGAIRRIAEYLRVHPSRFSYAGTKDKTSISTQLVSVFRINEARILRLNLRDIVILSAWRSDEKVRIGNLLGNRFTITLSGTNCHAEEMVKKKYCELNGVFPNYFGEQRFGVVRENTHKIGEQIVRGNYQLAASMFLGDSNGETNSASVAARKNFRDSGDYARALKEFPSHLTLERKMLEHLENHPRDYANAFRKLPRSILLLFVHAFQSYLFNALLSERISEGEVIAEDGEHYCGERCGFPDARLKCSSETCWIAGKIIGYESALNEREKALLERFDLRKSDLSIKGIPEISSKGTHRLLFSPLVDFSFMNNTFRFSLPAGSYATVALREFMDESSS